MLLNSGKGSKAKVGHDLFGLLLLMCCLAFVGPENVEEDGIGMFESRSMVLRKAGKSKIRKTAKTRYIKNPLLSKMIAAYFDPSEEAERQHVGLGRKVCFDFLTWTTLMHIAPVTASSKRTS